MPEADDHQSELAARLQTAARRYCIERHAHCVAKYSELQRGREDRIPYDYSQAVTRL